MRKLNIFFILLFAISVLISACKKTPVEKNIPVDLGNKQNVIDFYISDYEGSNQYGADWTGSTSSCNSGTISNEALANTLKRVNYFRVSAGLPTITHFDTELNAKCQKGALMMYANQELSHTPPTTWSCYTQDGYDAASHSNIATNTGSSSITSYMSDHGIIILLDTEDGYYTHQQKQWAMVRLLHTVCFGLPMVWNEKHQKSYLNLLVGHPKDMYQAT